jgi:sulfur-oxidizing protein SoxX
MRLLFHLILSKASSTTASIFTANDALDAALAAPGDALRGRQVFVTREQGHCVICHALAGMAPAGNLGPALDGVGARVGNGDAVEIEEVHRPER